MLSSRAILHRWQVAFGPQAVVGPILVWYSVSGVHQIWITFPAFLSRHYEFSL